MNQSAASLVYPRDMSRPLSTAAVASLFTVALGLAGTLYAPHATAGLHHRARARTPASGCSDGEREAFRDAARYPRIAACSGAWQVAGIAVDAPPSCDRKGGDDGRHADGRGCGASDLCAPEWHVCTGSADVTRSSPDGCEGAHDAVERGFFATRQSGPGCRECATGANPSCTSLSCEVDCAPSPAMTNDLFCCGTLGDPPAASCGPLDRFSGNLCALLGAPWSCNNDAGEASVVVKRASTRGGVLCCRDS